MEINIPGAVKLLIQMKIAHCTLKLVLHSVLFKFCLTKQQQVAAIEKSRIYPCLSRKFQFPHQNATSILLVSCTIAQDLLPANEKESLEP